MDKKRLRKIYDRTDGYCHICHKKLSFTNYASYGSMGVWEIEHSNARANGGSNRLNNLFAACVSCNISKGVKSTRTARAKHGHTRAPYSKVKKQQIRKQNTATGAVIGGLVGSIFGPGGAIIGAGICAKIGNDSSPKK